ncbi:ATP-dependent RNA helicase HrpA [Arcanobacterium hippocoleae]
MTENQHSNPHNKSRRQKNRRQPRNSYKPFTPAELAARKASLPHINYPAELPVSAQRENIAQAIRTHQVVILAGETGSGKTTQLPKICLEIGRGINGMIGHTQPRRIAARSVAERISKELGINLGGTIGYQVRFTEIVSRDTLVKLMTDGILLAEIQADPLLQKYDTIIIDEAHERSLNIDFLLGYLAQLLPSRPDLKLIITSATIDSQRFAAHFAKYTQSASQNVPIIEVSGRTYPVEIRYRPLDGSCKQGTLSPFTPATPAKINTPNHETDFAASEYLDAEPQDQISGILNAASELMQEGAGDILVFLSGEGEIRETQKAFHDELGSRYIAPGGSSKIPGAVEVLPLFARLSAGEQHRIFEPHNHRRIILSTNIAETSLTVPGIRYVIDPGTARISRYSNKTKVQRLPIEPISQASANQRSGRCGRIADGIAIRLYSADDFASRPEFTEPEIQRTSLAAVILQMAALNLGTVADFPFIDPPDLRAVRAGAQLLEEIGALEIGVRQPKLTKIGRKLARLPIDPRLGRMLLAANENGCAAEVLILVAAMSVQDVRERPLEFKTQADQLHARFTEASSDFLAYLNLWRYLRTQQRELSGSGFRKMCRAEYLHWLRFREWEDVVLQLRQLAKPLGITLNEISIPDQQQLQEAARALADEGKDSTHHRDIVTAVKTLANSADVPAAEAIHQSLLVGMLSNLGNWDERKRDYAGARGTHFVIWPGSGLYRRTPAWVMAAELVETSRLFARTVARIDSDWIEKVAGHLIKHQYSEPYWSTRNGAAMAHEKSRFMG